MPYEGRRCKNGKTMKHLQKARPLPLLADYQNQKSWANLIRIPEQARQQSLFCPFYTLLQGFRIFVTRKVSEMQDPVQQA